MKISAFAKVNLSLEVYAKRADGYHDLRSVVLPITLADELVIEPAARFSSDTGYGERDLCLRAAHALAAACAQPVEPVSVHVVKRIPVGGGLGGGSADAAATLRALNEFWRTGLSSDQLARIGAEIGSDVPALVLVQDCRCPVLMEGRGERVSRIELSRLDQKMLPTRHLVLVNPGVPVSTAEVYSQCVARLAPTEDPVNDLELPAVRLCPKILETMERLSAEGVKGVRMSGSGSTVFGFVESAESADFVVGRLQALGLSAWSSSPLDGCRSDAD